MKASEARVRANEINASSKNEALKKIRAAIEKAANTGSFGITTYDRLTLAVKDQLISEGYQVREWDDQRDGYGCEITW